MKITYTPEHKSYFERFYNIRTNEQFRRMFEKRFGMRISKRSVCRQARIWGLTEPPAEYMTLREISSITGESTYALTAKVKRGTLPAVKKGKLWLVLIEHAEQHIQSILTTPPTWPALTVREAADMLGYAENTIRNAVHRGLPSYRVWSERQYRLMVSRRHIEAAARVLRRTGKLRINWRALDVNI